CLSCHSDIIKTAKTQVFVHKPIEEGNCDKCHTPHYGKLNNLLLTSGAGICKDCHSLSNKALKEKHLNRSLTNMDCTNCHTPHSATSKPLFRRVMHKPFKEGRCRDCHES
ncbi:MAG TPA: hypothetical protein ENJ03_00920, partial [Candidatus Desulfofervidus auxilii]|nr:hypothetical protein [Candidatus Desulfofervidus auxilii]